MQHLSRRLRMGSSTSALVLCLLWPIVSAAQTSGAVNPGEVSFVASADHATIQVDGQPAVTRYDFEIWLSSEASKPTTVLSLGKPTPDAANKITVKPAVLIGLPLGDYKATVAAVGPVGTGRSDPPFPFQRRDKPAAPMGLILR